MTGKWQVYRFSNGGDGSFDAIWLGEDELTEDNLLTSPTVFIGSEGELEGSNESIIELIYNQLKTILIDKNNMNNEFYMEALSDFNKNYDDSINIDDFLKTCQMMSNELEPLCNKYKLIEKGKFEPPLL